MFSVGSALSSTQMIWDPSFLDRALLDSFVPSVRQAQAFSRTRAHLRGAGVTVRHTNAASLKTAQAVMMPTGLGWVQETGREGGYPIFPGGTSGLRRVGKKKYGKTRVYDTKMKGGFSSSAGAIAFNGNGGKVNTGVRWFTFGGDLKADPYIAPGAALWSSQLYKDTCRAMLARRGFGVGAR